MSEDDRGFEHSRVLHVGSAHCQLAEDITSSVCFSQSMLRYADREKTETRPDGNYYYPSQSFSWLYWHDNLSYICIAKAVVGLLKTIKSMNCKQSMEKYYYYIEVTIRSLKGSPQYMLKNIASLRHCWSFCHQLFSLEPLQTCFNITIAFETFWVLSVI